MRYDQYRMNGKELLAGAAKGVTGSALFAYTFYRSSQVFFWMLPIGIAAGCIMERRRLLEKRFRDLSMQFKESMMILAASLSAGYSVENALAAGVDELMVLYGKDGLITREFIFMVQQIRMNIPVEKVLGDFADRSGLEDVRNFAEVFSVAKRSSGDLGNIMRHTAEVIRDKMQVKEEIITLTASRQFEQKIMNMIPFLLVFYIEGSSPGFFDQMYGTSLGRILMSGCLLVYLVAYGMAKKILSIEI